MLVPLKHLRNNKLLVVIKNILAIFLVITLLYACQKPQAVDYRDVKNISIKSLGFNQSSISMDLVYYNPNNFAIDLRKVDCDIYINDTYLGKYVLDTLAHIGKRTEFVLPSTMKVDMKGVFKNTVNVLFNKEITLHLKGSTKIGKGGLFINFPFNYSGKHNFSLFQ